MKRHPALVPLSHDHHLTLVHARELRRAADADPEERRAAAGRFLRHFDPHVVRHFREEEEVVFPLLPLQPPELDRVLVEHQRIRSLAGRLRSDPAPETLVQLGTLLEEHIRLEERIVFELVQEHAAAAELAAVRLAPREQQAGARGPIWGAESEDLNATLLEWPAGEGPGEHLNEHLDVLYAVVAGSATLTVDGEAQELRVGEARIVEKGARRAVVAGPGGVRYLTAHIRRGGLQIRRAPA